MGPEGKKMPWKKEISFDYFAIQKLEEQKEAYAKKYESHEWIKDEDRTNCTNCRAEFKPMRRRHHCRKCFEIFCSTCCPGSAVRECLRCARKLPYENMGLTKASQLEETYRTEAQKISYKERERMNKIKRGPQIDTSLYNRAWVGRPEERNANKIRVVQFNMLSHGLSNPRNSGFAAGVKQEITQEKFAAMTAKVDKIVDELQMIVLKKQGMKMEDEAKKKSATFKKDTEGAKAHAKHIEEYTKANKKHLVLFEDAEAREKYFKSWD